MDGWKRLSTAHPLTEMCEVILYEDPDHPVFHDSWSAEGKEDKQF